MPEIEWRDRRGRDEHVGEGVLVNNRLSVGTVARDEARRIATEAANVERHFVVEVTDPTTHNRPPISKGRPCQANTRREILLAGDGLILVTKSKVKTQIVTDEPAILCEAAILTIGRRNLPVRAQIKRDALGKRAMLTHDVDRTRSEEQMVADTIEVEADFDLVRAVQESHGRQGGDSK